MTCVQALAIIDKLTQQHQQDLKSSSQPCSSSSSSSGSSSCSSRKSSHSFSSSGEDVDALSNIPNSLLANIYQQISVLHFYRSEYDLSYRWSIRALKHINKHTPDR